MVEILLEIASRKLQQNKIVNLVLNYSMINIPKKILQTVVGFNCEQIIWFYFREPSTRKLCCCLPASFRINSKFATFTALLIQSVVRNNGKCYNMETLPI